jgi:hypothetical protein
MKRKAAADDTVLLELSTRLGVSKGDTEASSAVLKVPHIRQKHSWDCGLACLQMVLAFLKPSGAYSHEELLADSDIDGQSVWSIGEHLVEAIAHRAASSLLRMCFVATRLGHDACEV